jgi:transcriptional regulator with XRE-family HTH domain
MRREPEVDRTLDGARLLRALRERARLTQEVVAERAGVSVRGLAKIESGRVAPRAQTLARLCAALGCDDAATDSIFAVYSRSAGAGATSPLVGRDEMLEALTRRLERERFIVLYGPGGAGKSALAAVLRARSTPWRTPSVAIEAADFADSGELLAAIVRACDAPLEAARCSVDRAARILRNERRFILVETIERCTQAAEDLETLVSACATLRILATSRTSPASRAGFAVTPLARDDAIALFERLVPIDVVANRAERREAISAACASVDDLPLGIEVAAAAVQFAPIEHLGSLLARDLGLARAARDGPSRHRSLERSVAWSYENLDAEQRDALRVLASFARSAELGALAKIANISLSAAVARFGSLVERNVAFSTAGLHGRVRLRLYDIVREFRARFRTAPRAPATHRCAMRAITPR